MATSQKLGLSYDGAPSFDLREAPGAIGVFQGTNSNFDQWEFHGVGETSGCTYIKNTRQTRERRPGRLEQECIGIVFEKGGI